MKTSGVVVCEGVHIRSGEEERPRDRREKRADPFHLPLHRRFKTRLGSFGGNMPG